MIPALPRNLELETGLFEKNDEFFKLLDVYSDWLQTQGHPMGELIALESQISLDAQDPGPEIRNGIRKHMEAILESWSLELEVDSKDLFDRPCTLTQRRAGQAKVDKFNLSFLELNWHYGRIDGIKIHLRGDSGHKEFLEQAYRVLDSPSSLLLESLHIRVRSGVLLTENADALSTIVNANSFLDELPGCEYLVRLFVTNSIKTPEGKGLNITLARFSRLARLSLAGISYTESWPNRPLPHLDLQAKQVPEQWPAMLADPELPEIERLELRIYVMESPGGVALCRSLQNERLQKLTHLDINLPEIRDAAQATLLYLNFPRLTFLDLQFGDGDTDAQVQDFFQRFIRHARLPELKVMTMRMRTLDKDSIRELAASDLLKTLGSLGFQGVHFDEENTQAMVDEYERFSRLDSISMYGARMTIEIAKQLLPVYHKVFRGVESITLLDG